VKDGEGSARRYIERRARISRLNQHISIVIPQVSDLHDQHPGHRDMYIPARTDWQQGVACCFVCLGFSVYHQLTKLQGILSEIRCFLLRRSQSMRLHISYWRT